MTYADFSKCMSRRAYQVGTELGPWNHVVWRPSSPVKTVAQFFDIQLEPTSGELMVRSGDWLYNNGFYNPDDSLNYIHVISEKTGGHPGQPPGGVDITVVGGPQHFALWEIPDYSYWTWTYATVAGNPYSHSQWIAPPKMIVNPYWRGTGPKERLCTETKEEWWDTNDHGVWALREKRICYNALDTGTMWLVIDELATDPAKRQCGMIVAWDY